MQNRTELRKAVSIRQMTVDDAEVAAQLSAELGYPAEVETMRERIARMNWSTDRIVFVACVSNLVVGWIDVALVHHLATGVFGEISGLVVSSKHRSCGIGQKLVAKAEEWATDHGVTNMVVRSRTTREAAHRFYLREGFSIVKTSIVFSKDLKPLATVK